MMPAVYHCAVLCLLMTLVSLTTGAGLLEKRNNPCEWRQFALESCIEQGNVDFDLLHRSTYYPQMCSEMSPVVQCVVQNRDECPDLEAFQGADGQSIDTFLASYGTLCSQGDGNQEGGPGLACEGGEGKFEARIKRCHEKHLAVNINLNDMCQPLGDAISCMEKQLGKFQACPWMTGAVNKQVQLGKDYFSALYAVRYGCNAN